MLPDFVTKVRENMNQESAPRTEENPLPKKQNNDVQVIHTISGGPSYSEPGFTKKR